MRNLFLAMIFLFIANFGFSGSNPILKTEKFDMENPEQKYFFVKLPVEINYQEGKVFADKDTPLVVEDRFKWKSTVDYNVCSTQCGTGSFNVNYTCEKSVLYGKEIVADELCEAKIGATPILPGPTCVNWNDCGQSYQYSEWSVCEGESTSSREGVCIDREGNSLPIDACSLISKEELTKTCSYPASCKEVLISNPTTTSGYYYLSPDGDSPHRIYCEMDFENGGWIVLGNTGSGVRTNLTESPSPGTAGYIDVSIMKKFAANASQIAFKRIGYDQHIISVPNAYPIQQLRNGNGLMRVGTNHSYWTSPQGIVTSARFNRVCGGGGTYQNGIHMWACGNESGIHLLSTYGRWAYNGSPFNITMLIR